MSKFNRKAQQKADAEVAAQVAAMSMSDYINDVRPALLGAGGGGSGGWSAGGNGGSGSGGNLFPPDRLTGVTEEATPVPATCCARCGREVERGTDGDWYDTDHGVQGGPWQCSAHPDGEGHEVPDAPEPEMVPCEPEETTGLSWVLSPSIFGTAGTAAYGPPPFTGTVTVRLIGKNGTTETTMPLTPGANYTEHFTDPITVTDIAIKA